MAIPFSKRTMSTVAVSICMFADKHAQHLTTSGVTISALQVIYAQLYSELRTLRHQDVVNQAPVLAAAIAAAITSVQALSTLVIAMPEPAPLPEDITTLPNIRIVVYNALQSLKAAQSAET